MNIYFDYSNLLSYIHSAKDKRYGDCERMLNDNFNYIFTFTKESLMDVSQDDKDDIDAWMTTLYNLKGKIVWGSEYPQNPLNMPDLYKEPNLRSVYCLDSNKRSNEIIDSGIVLAANVGSELDIISSLLVNSNQYTKDIFDDIKCWDDIKKYASPCSDIIIVDQYIFSSTELYEYNIYKIIQCLTDNVKEMEVNIVIVTLNKNYDRIANKSNIPQWNIIFSKIRKKVKSKKKPNVTFITATKEKLEHDRTLFTNYKVFSSGDSLNYFNSQGQIITGGRWLHVHSLADPDNLKKAEKFLNDIQNLIDDIKKDKRAYIDNVQGSKKSYFLNF